VIAAAMFVVVLLGWSASLSGVVGVTEYIANPLARMLTAHTNAHAAIANVNAIWPVAGYYCKIYPRRARK